MYIDYFAVSCWFLADDMLGIGFVSKTFSSALVGAELCFFYLFVFSGKSCAIKH